MLAIENRKSIDHIVVLSPSVKTGCRYIRAKTGTTPVYGGEHTGFGSCNYLLSLGDLQYLEVFAPLNEPTSKDTENEWLRTCRSLELPKPYTFCVAVDDFDALALVLSNHNIATTGPIKMQRQPAEGDPLQWQLLTCFDNRFGPVFPFFIKWDDCEHPAKTSPVGCSLHNIAVRHPQAEELSAVFDALDLHVAVQQSQTAALDVVLSTPNGCTTL